MLWRGHAWRKGIPRNRSREDSSRAVKLFPTSPPRTNTDWILQGPPKVVLTMKILPETILTSSSARRSRSSTTAIGCTTSGPRETGARVRHLVIRHFPGRPTAAKRASPTPWRRQSRTHSGGCRPFALHYPGVRKLASARVGPACRTVAGRFHTVAPGFSPSGGKAGSHPAD